MSFQERMTAKEYYSQPGFSNFIGKIFQKYKGLGRVGGNIETDELTIEESQRLLEFFGPQLRKSKQYIRPGDIIKVPIKLFIVELYRGYRLTIPELYEVLKGRPLLTNADIKEMESRQWTLLFLNVRDEFEGKHKFDLLQEETSHPICNWFSMLKQGSARGSRILQNMLRQDQKKASEELGYCMNALWFLKNDMIANLKSIGINVPWIRLPVLATHITKDSHALDWKRSLGKLFWSALSEIDSTKLQSEPKQSTDTKLSFDDSISMNRRKIYRNSGIKDDDISSDVKLFAQPFTQFDSPSTMTLREVEIYPVWPEYSDLYVVENPSVIGTMADEAIEILDSLGVSFRDVPSDFPIIICTSGQPSAAAISFISRCLDVNPTCRLNFSGDFDLAGLQIAIGIYNQFPNAFQEWYMNSETYRSHSMDGVPISDEDKKLLMQMEVPWSNDLGIEMEKIGIKRYHEAIIHELNADWIKAVNEVLEKMK
ncbi:TIGR02679 domain-containing protein [Cohnella silvisoli]|uniref:TIGR02679 domain-containing protein n=1 Tax=Cohnella silvisoli TaxID=2873699 RepID=A0ABV1KPQ1_9BACL|nr:TIGR02679 domain-containing protein [Cohnella silvisoli]MCD9020215.1 TIGR02679 domain-containing protein [Cohnella silvisoli]